MSATWGCLGINHYIGDVDLSEHAIILGNITFYLILPCSYCSILTQLHGEAWVRSPHLYLKHL